MLLQLFWSQKADKQWYEAWETAPRSDSLFDSQTGSGATQFEMSCESDWLGQSRSLQEWQQIGEGRHPDLTATQQFDRVWISDLFLVYWFRIEPEDGRVTIYEFARLR